MESKYTTKKWSIHKEWLQERNRKLQNSQKTITNAALVSTYYQFI